MKCEKCGSHWMRWQNLGRINQYMYCPDCGREQYQITPDEEEKEDEDEVLEMS